MIPKTRKKKAKSQLGWRQRKRHFPTMHIAPITREVFDLKPTSEE
jgi:hypothetical protein